MSSRTRSSFTMMTATVGVLTAGLLVGATGTAQAHTAVGHTTVSYDVAGYEDGSGRITRTVRHTGKGVILTTVVPLTEGLLPWECDRNGNRVCGPGVLPSADRRTKTVTLVIARRPGMPHSVALTYSTTGALSARIATDVDAEGQVV